MQILIDIDPKMAADLDRVAPARSRKRSEFVRAAIRRALMEEAERHTKEAYSRIPDSEPVYFDPDAWTPRPSERKHPARASSRRTRAR